ncbi:MAG: BPL-N domain-containing protein [Thermodesulfovibrionales bacterium]|nr:BPL-N domain-containing protein [Thermodesulfovibrionales bacterium]
MAYKAMKANGLSFELIRAEDIKKGRLKKYAMLFVPGGWASNKLKSLGDKGIKEIKRFVRNGGNYLGFCGGAGLATLDGMGLLNIKRKPTKERVPSFSGRIHLNITKHPIWKYLEQSAASHQLSAVSKLIPNPQSPIPIFNAWWPSQFLTPPAPPLSKGGNRRGIEILATYGNALPDSFSSDLNVGDVEMNSNWTELEEIYGINLNPKRLKNEPAVIEGAFGKGRVILSLIHFDTPDDENGAKVLRNLWNHLAGKQSAVNSQRSAKNSKLLIHSNIMSNNYRDIVIPACPESFLGKDSRQAGVTEKEKSSLDELESAVTDLISLGIRNFLWFWRNPMLLQWRRGVRGLEYCTLYVMVKELSALSGQLSGRDKEKLQRVKKLLMPFTKKAKQLLILERHAMQKGHITPLSPPLLRGGWGGYDPAIQKIRTELFGDSKSHGGLFKNLIDETDKLLYALIKMEASR